MTASVAGVATSASFDLTNTPGNPASVTVVSGSNQSATVATGFTNPLVVQVEDKYNNPVPNVMVTFAAPTSGASAALAGSPAATGTNGQAQVSATANTMAGSYSVTASVAGVATSASFDLTNTAGNPASIAVVSGSGQTATVGKGFTDPLVVVVEDKYSNPVPNVTVTFAAPTSGASAALAGSPATTGTNGQAQVSAIANSIPGSYTVTASTAGVAPSAEFTLDNLYRIVPQFNTTKAHNSGSTVPIQIELTNAQGQNLGSSRLPVTAVSVIGPGGPVPLQSPGNSQPGNLFTFDPCTGTYEFNLKTKGYAPGTYTLYFTVGTDPTRYSITFMIG